MQDRDYEIVHSLPSVADYCRLRQQTGLSAKSHEAASRGLPRSLFAVQVLYHNQTVAMGRVIGDDGCFYQITDIAVLPEHQGRGLAKQIMQSIVDYLQQHAPASAYVSLLADGEAQHLYAKFGFRPTAPASVGMFRKF